MASRTTRALRAASWAALLLLPGLAFGDPMMAADFESGTLLTTDNPPGPWTVLDNPAPSNVVEASRAAAHRGAWGMRVVDSTASGPANGEGSVYTEHRTSYGPDLYTRMWFRVFKANGVGEVIAMMVRGASGKTTSQADLNFDGRTSYSLGIIGDTSTGWQSSPATVSLGVGEWHLLELNQLGSGTATGTRELWVDGNLVARVTANWSGMDLIDFGVGEPWSGDRTFTGELHLDDVRVGTQPLASRLALSAPSTPAACVPVQVTLLSSAMVPAPTVPYDVAVDLVGAEGQLYADSGCQKAATQAVIPSGQSAVVVYVNGAGGSRSVVAQHVDFLSSAPLTVGGAGAGPSSPVGAPRSSIYTRGCSSAGPESLSGLTLLALGRLVRRRSRPKGFAA